MYIIIFFLQNTGIGYALAKEFLKAGDNVIICSRSSKDVLLYISLFKVQFFSFLGSWYLA